MPAEVDTPTMVKRLIVATGAAVIATTLSLLGTFIVMAVGFYFFWVGALLLWWPLLILAPWASAHVTSRLLRRHHLSAVRMAAGAWCCWALAYAVMLVAGWRKVAHPFQSPRHFFRMLWEVWEVNERSDDRFLAVLLCAWLVGYFLGAASTPRPSAAEGGLRRGTRRREGGPSGIA